MLESKKCECCWDQMTQYASGIIEHGERVPLFKCERCKYKQIVFDDADNAVIRTKTVWGGNNNGNH